jgi:hypothetical protein
VSDKSFDDLDMSSTDLPYETTLKQLGSHGYSRANVATALQVEKSDEIINPSDSIVELSLSLGFSVVNESIHSDDRESDEALDFN